jgi:acyl transferase domain-containing protein
MSAALDNIRDDSISVIGIGVKLPGANDKVEFFEMLKNKRSGIVQVPSDRWNKDTYTDKGAIPSKICTDRGGFIDEIHEFDNLEFGIAPNEAFEMDPHQMILMNTLLQAFEDSGLPYRGTNCGVYVAGTIDAHNVHRDQYDINAYTATGAALSIQANRLSYAFDLNGPSMFVDTACSGGLTAVHLARNAILAGDCSTAAVSGISIICSPNASQSFSKLGTLSEDGVCRAFDADANGYVRGEGCATVIIKRTKDAIRDDNHIYAEISGSAINANGRGTSLTMPEGKMQMATTRSAYEQSGRSPFDAAYVECHGTGTNVGDPIEANGVGQVFSANRDEDDRLAIGSVKTNVGHLETGAGVVSLIKACLILDSGLLLPSLNFNKPNPKIKWDEYMIKVQTEVEPLPQHKLTKDGKFVVSVSSFGFGGSNSHMVLERRQREPEKLPTLTEKDPLLVAVGGMTQKSVGNVTNIVKEAFASVGDVPSAALAVTSNLATTRWPRQMISTRSSSLSLAVKVLSMTRWVESFSLDTLLSASRSFVVMLFSRARWASLSSMTMASSNPVQRQLSQPMLAVSGPSNSSSLALQSSRWPCTIYGPTLECSQMQLLATLSVKLPPFMLLVLSIRSKPFPWQLLDRTHWPSCTL